jgi:hypothetical protein
VIIIGWLLGAATFAASPTASGAWIGTLDIGGSLRPIVIQFHERDNRELLGYVLGGTGSRTVVDGQRQGSTVTFSLELRDPVRTSLLNVNGRLHGDTLDAVADDGATSRPFVLTRTADLLQERRFLFVEPRSDSLVAVSVVLDSGGTFVTGGFVGERDCRTWACSGGLTSFSEVGPNLVIGLETGGGCSAGSTVDVTFDETSKLYSGTYSFTDCEGTTTGSVIAGRATRTRSDDVALILEALGRLADDFGERDDFGSTHPSFSSTYLSYGRSLADVLSDFNAERAAYSSIEAAFNRIRSINTVDDPDTFPVIRQPFGAFFDERRSGLAGRDAPVTYVDTHAAPNHRPLGVWVKEGSRWVIVGNQVDALTLPFDYAAGTSHLIAPTAGGPVHVSIGPYGAHFSPLTGHSDGDSKGNLMGFFTATRSGLTELAGDLDGLCEPGESCGFYGGSDGSLIRNRVPAYKAPLDAQVAAISYTPPNGLYLDNAPKWQVAIQLYAGHLLEFDHVGRIGASLRDKVLMATGIDTDTYTGPPGDLPGVAGITVSAGEVVAYPQVVAVTVAGYPGYYGADVGGIRQPFVQMEFSLSEGLLDKTCLYDHLPGATQSSLQAVLDADMADPTSQRFDLTPRRWQWSAEGRLCMAYWSLPQDFSGLFTNMGGWFKIEGPGSSPDQLVGFAPIATNTASYDASLYEPGTSMLVARQQAFGGAMIWDLPGLGPTPVYYPSGEILERTADSLLIKWRTTGLADIVAYQRAAYFLNEDGLKVAWGSFASTPGGAVLPAVSPVTPCDETVVICYDHTGRDGF